MHDRHWKIHWMLNFAQLSATLNLRAVMEKTHGKIDEVLLGRLQNSADDRNWDKIRALWEMKEEVKADAELPGRLRQGSARPRSSRPSRPASAAAASSTSGWSRTRRSSAGTPSGATSSSSPSFREDMNPVIQLVRDQYTSDYDYPTKVAALKADIDAAAAGDPRGARGRGAREDARRQRDQPQDGAAHPGPPLLHRPGRQRARPPRARRHRREARGDGHPRPARRRRSCSATTRSASSSAPRTRHGRPRHRRGRPGQA